MNAQPAITRDEFDEGFAQLRNEIVALKKVVASAAARGEGGTPDPRAGAFVQKDEFRLFKWFSGIALATILGALGFLHQGVADLRVTVERQHGELRSYMDRQFAELSGETDNRFTGLRGEMNQRFDGLRGEMDKRFDGLRGEMDERFAGLSGEMDRRFTEVDRRFTDVDRQLASIRERLVRVETLVTVESPPGEAGATDAR